VSSGASWGWAAAHHGREPLVFHLLTLLPPRYASGFSYPLMPCTRGVPQVVATSSSRELTGRRFRPLALSAPLAAKPCWHARSELNPIVDPSEMKEETP